MKQFLNACTKIAGNKIMAIGIQRKAHNEGDFYSEMYWIDIHFFDDNDCVYVYDENLAEAKKKALKELKEKML